MATPIIVNQSTTLVQIDTSVALGVGEQYIVRLSSVNTPGSLVTIRDIAGNAFVNNIIISTTQDVKFLDGGGVNNNIYKIIQNYGFLTVTPKTDKVWGVLNTFGFPDSSAAANINTITTNSLTVNNSYQMNSIISTALISTLSTDNVFIRANLSVGQSTIAHAGYFACTIRALDDMITHGTLYAASTVSSMFGNFTSTLTVPYISTQNIEIYGVLRSASTISTVGPLFVGNAISTTANLAVGGDTSIQGELKVQNNVNFQSSLSTLYRLGVGAETQLYSTLSVRHDILTNGSLSTISNVNVGGALSVMKSAFFIGQVSTQSNLTVGGALSVMNTFYTYGDAVLNSSLSVVGSISTLSNVYIASTLSVGKDLIVHGDSYLNNITLLGSVSVGRDLFVNNNISTYSSIFAGGDLRIMGSTFLMGHVSTLSNMTVGGGISTMKDLAVAGTSYFGSNVLFQSSVSTLANLMVQGHLSTLSTVAIGHNLLVQSNLITGTFSTIGAAAFYSSMQIQGSLSVFSSIAVSCNLDVGNALTVSSITAKLFEVSTMTVLQQSNFCITINSSTLHHGLFSTLGGINAGGPISTMNTLAVGSTIDTQFITVRQNLSTIGDACIGSNLFVLSSIHSGMSTIVNGGFYANGQALFTKSVRMNSLTVDAGATVNGGVTFSGNMQINAGLIAQNVFTAFGGINIPPFSEIFNNPLAVRQNQIYNDTYMSSIKTSSITVYGFQSTFGQAAFDSSVNIKDDLSVRGNANINGTLTTSVLNINKDNNTLLTANMTIGNIPSNIPSIFAGSGATGSFDATGLAATFEGVHGIIAAADGTIYVFSTTGKIRKITKAGVVTTIATLTGAALPGDIDAEGNIYCTNGNAISKVTQSGVVTLVAGQVDASGAGFINGTGAAARLRPRTVALGADGNLYVADFNNYCIRKITLPGGVVTTFAGSAGISGYADGVGTAAIFSTVDSIIRGIDGNLYVVDRLLLGVGTARSLRKITLGGVVTTIAGGSIGGYVDAVGTEARFKNPVGLAMDPLGNFYVVDDAKIIRKVTPSGAVTTFYSALDRVYQICVDIYGNLFAGEFDQNVIKKFPAVPYYDPKMSIDGDINIQNTGLTNFTATTFVGSGAAGPFTAGTGLSAILHNPLTCAIGPDGTIYVINRPTYATICQISPAGVVSLLAGSTSATGLTDGTGSDARFGDSPRFITYSSAIGALIIKDQNLIRKITRGGVVSLVYSNTNNIAGFCVDSSGNIYFIDSVDFKLYKISSPYAVNSRSPITTLTSDAFACAIDSQNNIYVTGATKIIKITLSPVTNTDFAGSTAGYSDGPGLSAQFSNIKNEIKIDASDNLYVTDTENLKIRKITPSGFVTTIANCTSTQFDLIFDSSGNLFSPDRDANILYKYNNPINVLTTQNGNVGIGTDTPNYKLDVNGTANINGSVRSFKTGTSNSLATATGEGYDNLILKSPINASLNSGGVTSMVFSGGNQNFHYARIYANDKSSGGGAWFGNLAFQTTSNGALYDRMTIDSSGNIGINKPSPAYPLDVSGNINFTGDLKKNGANVTFTPAGINSAGNIGINKASGTVALDVNGDIIASGNVTAYSDQRAKENIVTIDSPLDKIMKMRGVYYTRKDIPGPRQVGVIAQEVEEILPEVVLTDSTEEKKKSVAYGNIVALLIEGMKAQQSTIDSLLQLVRS